MEPLRLKENDIIKMKKKHPCGCDTFKIVRVGSDVRIICEGCGRDVTVPRVKLEKSIKKILEND